MKATIAPVIITAAHFKATCLKLMEQTASGGTTFLVTKRGKPVMLATAPPSRKKTRSFIGATAGSLKAKGDIVSALPNEWNAESD